MSSKRLILASLLMAMVGVPAEAYALGGAQRDIAVVKPSVTAGWQHNARYRSLPGKAAAAQRHFDAEVVETTVTGIAGQYVDRKTRRWEYPTVIVGKRGNGYVAVTDTKGQPLAKKPTAFQPAEVEDQARKIYRDNAIEAHRGEYHGGFRKAPVVYGAVRGTDGSLQRVQLKPGSPAYEKQSTYLRTYVRGPLVDPDGNIVHGSLDGERLRNAGRNGVYWVRGGDLHTIYD
jgi:hypothetical protein